MLSAISVIESYKLRNFNFLIMHQNMIQYRNALNTVGCESILVSEQLFDKTSNHGWIRNHVHVLLNIIRKNKFFRKTPFLQKYIVLYMFLLMIVHVELYIKN